MSMVQCLAVSTKVGAMRVAVQMKEQAPVVASTMPMVPTARSFAPPDSTPPIRLSSC